MAHPSQPQPSARPPVQPSTLDPVSRTGETVTVACKLPLGIMMQVFEMEDAEEIVGAGAVRKFKRARAVGPAIKLNGSAKYRGSDHETLHDIRHGAGLTFGVPKDAFDRWVEANKDNEFISKGLVFAHRSDAQSMAAERVSVKTGLEPVDPKAKVLDPETRGVVEQAA